MRKKGEDGAERCPSYTFAVRPSSPNSVYRATLEEDKDAR